METSSSSASEADTNILKNKLLIYITILNILFILQILEIIIFVIAFVINGCSWYLVIYIYTIIPGHGMHTQ